MARSDQEIEKSILLDQSSDSEYVHNEAFPSVGVHKQNVPLGSSDINKLKAESSQKFKKKWDEIIAKYSSIDDSLESDEIDLQTGKIIVDNGHLRSLEEVHIGPNGLRLHPNMWADNYEFHKTPKRRSKLQQSERKSKLDHNQKLRTRSQFQNTNVVPSDSDALEDNLSILSSSPIKRHRTTEFSGGEDALNSPQSDTKRIGLVSPRNVPRSSPLKNRLIDRSPQVSDNDILYTPTKPRHTTLQSTGSPILLRPLTGQHVCDGKKTRASRIQDSVQTEETNDDPDDSLSLSDMFESREFAYFSCAFNNCSFHCRDKASYRAHLLATHSQELQQIGYPVTTNSRSTFTSVPELTILRLNLHFPLDFEVPSKSPYRCSLKVGSRPCQKLFLDKKQMSEHQSHAPKFCSTKKQVLICPLLGCDFMTDGSYTEFQAHLKSHNSKMVLNKGNLIDQTSTVENVSDIFSDTVSSLSFTDSDHESFFGNVIQHSENFTSSGSSSNNNSSRTAFTLPVLDITD